MTRYHPKRAAFTLVELLVVIAIVGLLASITLVALSNVRQKADEVKAANRLRSTGQAMKLYTVDNGGALPGPLWPGQMAEYNPNRSGRLIRILAPYMDIPATDSSQLIMDFIPPAYSAVYDANRLSTARIYVMNDKVTLDSGGDSIQPFGDLTAEEVLPPMMLQSIPSGVLDQWLMSDADQQHPNVASKSWGSNTPESPIYGNFRHVLYYDWRVEKVAVDATP